MWSTPGAGGKARPRNTSGSEAIRQDSALPGVMILLPSQFMNSREAGEGIRQDGARANDRDDGQESTERRGEIDGGMLE